MSNSLSSMLRETSLTKTSSTSTGSAAGAGVAMSRKATRSHLMPPWLRRSRRHDNLNLRRLTPPIAEHRRVAAVLSRDVEPGHVDALAQNRAGADEADAGGDPR